MPDDIRPEAPTSTEALEAVSALADDVRRKLYEFVRCARRPVTRDEAAEATGVSRKLAAFHLDKLLERGLLRASFSRPPGRSGPGAGRPAKRYEPSGAEWSVTVPERRYDLAGRILTEAVSRSTTGTPAPEVAREVARRQGVQIGAAWAQERGVRRPGPARTLTACAELLAELGYAPERQGGTVLLWNCPFHALVEVDTPLVCGLNQNLLSGVVEGMEGQAEAALEPGEGRCCVVLRRED